MVRRFEDVSRLSCVHTATIALPNDGPTFTKQCWIVAMPCGLQVSRVGGGGGGGKSDGGAEWTLVKTCCRVACSSRGRESCDPVAAKELVALVIKALVRQARDYAQRLQDDLVDRHSLS